MHIGFSGTRAGMTRAQKESVFYRLALLEATHLHHGDCIGADEQAHWIAIELGLKVILHPPTDDSQRAGFIYGVTEMRSPKPYLRRNKDIVKETEVLIATPRGSTEVLRSGTWATVRHARKLERLRYVYGPNGKELDV